MLLSMIAALEVFQQKQQHAATTVKDGVVVIVVRLRFEVTATFPCGKFVVFVGGFAGFPPELYSSVFLVLVIEHSCRIYRITS